ncbi:MAG: hypothetical protein AM325_013660, partial [Candidatus Thorarchaeota archaeon SMTZ1-45]
VSVEKSSSQVLQVSVKEINKVESSQGILDRLKLIPYREPPQRDEDDDDSEQYYPAKEITRARMHKERKKSDIQKIWTRRPPLFVVPRDIRIGEREYRREVWRILRTAEFLCNRTPDIQQDWRRLLNDVVTVCKEERKKSVDVLEDVKKILAQKKESRDIWKLLIDVRKESINVTQKVESTKSALWELFGNDLYLLVLAIFHDDELEIDVSAFDVLWSSFSDWQFSNMGYIPYEQPDTYVTSKYDVISIWTNLRWRAKQLGRIRPVIGVFEDYRFGLLVNINQVSSWLMIQTRSGQQSMNAGYSESFQWPFRWKWYDCITDPFQLEEVSDSSWDSAVPIVITQSEGKDILWTPRMEDDEIVQWWAEGLFECGMPPEGRLVPIRWFRLSRIPDTLKSRLIQPEVNIPSNLEDIVNITLEEMDGLSDYIRKVSCRVTIDVDSEVYQIQFFDKKSRKTDPTSTFDIENTTELIQTLRHPTLKGIPFKNELWWNPESDIKFTKVDTEYGPIDLTFLKPFTYRSRRGSKLLRNVTLPKTASDLLQTRLGDSITLVADSNLEQMAYPYAKYWRILFLQTKPSEKMLRLQNIDVNIIEIAQFFESKQFIDTTTRLRHPLRFVITNLKQVSFPEDVFRYSEIATYLEEKDIVATDENDFEDSG